MPGIGETLREARMRQGVDLAEVEARTKIRAKYLRALENDEFGLLPGSTFVRSFLRTYAEFLGLDASLLIDEFRTRHEPPEDVEPLQPLGASQPRGRASGDRGPRFGGGGPSPGLIVGGVLLAVLAVLAVIGITGGSGDDTKGTASNTEASTQRRAPRRPRRAKKKPPTPQRVKVRITPLDPTYVCVDKGAGTPKVFEGSIDGPRSFKGKTVRINMGKRTAKVTVGGKAVEIAQNGTPIGLEFKPGKKPKQLPAGVRPCS